MSKHSRIFPSTRCYRNFFTRLEQVTCDDGVVNFCFEDVVETFFAEFLGGFWTLKLEFERRGGTFIIGLRV
jgi:hypothetical protein